MLLFFRIPLTSFDKMADSEAKIKTIDNQI